MPYSLQSVGLKAVHSAIFGLAEFVDKRSHLKSMHSIFEISEGSVSNIWIVLAYTSHEESPSVAQSGLVPKLSSVTEDTANSVRGKYQIQSPASSWVMALPHRSPCRSPSVHSALCIFLWHGSESGYASSLTAGVISPPPGPQGHLTTVCLCASGCLCCGLVVACTATARLVFWFGFFPGSQRNRVFSFLSGTDFKGVNILPCQICSSYPCLKKPRVVMGRQQFPFSVTGVGTCYFDQAKQLVKH